MLRQPPSYTGHNVGMARAAATSRGSWPPGSDVRQPTGTVTEPRCSSDRRGSHRKGVTLDEPRARPDDAQRRRVYLAETPAAGEPPSRARRLRRLRRPGGRARCGGRPASPTAGLGRVPGFRPGHGARQAFFASRRRRARRSRSPAATAPRASCSTSSSHWALADARSTSRRTAARSPACCSTPPTSSCGAERAERARRRRTAEHECTSAGRRGSGPTAGCTTAGTSGCASGRARPWPSCTRRVTAVRSRRPACYEGYERGASTLRVRVARRTGASDAHLRRDGVGRPPDAGGDALRR